MAVLSQSTSIVTDQEAHSALSCNCNKNTISYMEKFRTEFISVNNDTPVTGLRALYTIDILKQGFRALL